MSRPDRALRRSGDTKDLFFLLVAFVSSFFCRFWCGMHTATQKIRLKPARESTGEISCCSEPDALLYARRNIPTHLGHWPCMLGFLTGYNRRRARLLRRGKWQKKKKKSLTTLKRVTRVPLGGSGGAVGQSYCDMIIKERKKGS